MGISSSKFASGGALKGAYAPPLAGITLPPKMDSEVREYMATVPAGKKGGDKIVLVLNGNDIPITIPLRKVTQDGGSRMIQPGDKFKFKYGNRERVIASTLPSLPGTTVVEAKPMIFSNVSHAFFSRKFNDQKEQSNMSKKVGGLLQEAQTQLLQQACEMGCNAVLGINCNISSDSSGEYGNSKIVIVTLTGTPCIVMRLEDLPVVQTKAVVVPDYVR
jgi:uncharacterized protein YbjQ (UPF0145 family)